MQHHLVSKQLKQQKQPADALVVGHQRLISRDPTSANACQIQGFARTKEPDFGAHCPDEPHHYCQHQLKTQEGFAGLLQRFRPSQHKAMYDLKLLSADVGMPVTDPVAFSFGHASARIFAEDWGAMTRPAFRHQLPYNAATPAQATIIGDSADVFRTCARHTSSSIQRFHSVSVMDYRPTQQNFLHVCCAAPNALQTLENSFLERLACSC